MTNTMAKEKTKRRLSPEDRREQLLDSAAALIVERGLSACSLEEVAVTAQVSKALIYKYFPTRDEMLKALVTREYKMLREQGAWMTPDMPLAKAVHESNIRTFEYLNARGVILREILSDRVTGKALGFGDREERVRRTWYFADKVAQTYSISPKMALIGTLITSNIPGIAAGSLERNGFTPREVADFWTVFLLGGWAACAARYGDRPSG